MVEENCSSKVFTKRYKYDKIKDIEKERTHERNVL